MLFTVADVEAAVEGIGKLGRRDAEGADDEDVLIQRVLVAIVDGHPDSAALALAALKTFDLPFYRW